jgi:hypothetical protein
VVSFTPRPFTPGKRVMRLCGPQSQSGGGSEEKKFPLSSLLNPNCPIAVGYRRFRGTGTDCHITPFPTPLPSNICHPLALQAYIYAVSSHRQPLHLEDGGSIALRSVGIHMSSQPRGLLLESEILCTRILLLTSAKSWRSRGRNKIIHFIFAT